MSKSKKSNLYPEVFLYSLPSEEGYEAWQAITMLRFEHKGVYYITEFLEVQAMEIGFKLFERKKGDFSEKTLLKRAEVKFYLLERIHREVYLFLHLADKQKIVDLIDEKGNNITLKSLNQETEANRLINSYELKYNYQSSDGHT